MKYHIRYEPIGGQWYYNIYRKTFLSGYLFLERYNTPENAKIRLAELNGCG